jgi:hypothetical protein
LEDNSLYKIHIDNKAQLQEVCDLFNALNVRGGSQAITEDHIWSFYKYGGFLDTFTLDEMEEFTRKGRHIITATVDDEICGALLVSGSKEDIQSCFIDKNIAIKNKLGQTSYGCMIGVNQKRNFVAKKMLHYAFEMFSNEGYQDFLIEVLNIKSYEKDGASRKINVNNNASTKVAQWLEGDYLGRVAYRTYDFSGIILKTELEIYSIDIQHALDHIFNKR